MIQLNGYIIFLLIFAAYSIIVAVLDKKEILKKYNITAYGPILMIRTQWGQGLLESLSKTKRIWRAYANIGIPLMVVCMILMLFLLLFQAYIVVSKYVNNREMLPPELTNPRNMLLLPGVNPMLPWSWTVWIIIGMIVAIIVHEFSHGILCKVEGIKVKSMGALFALIPIGAFAEPDETQLFGPKEGDETDESFEGQTASSIQRSRILAAGVMSNFVIAAIAFILFFGLISTSIAPAAEGVPIGDVMDDFPAKEAGIKAGMIITGMDGVQIKNAHDFLVFINKTKPGQIIEVEVNSGEVFELNLTSDPHNMTTIGYLGIYSEPRGTKEYFTFLKDLPKSAGGWLIIWGLPIIIGFGGFDGSLIPFYKPVGPFAFMGNGIFWIANSLLWIGFINLVIATFNSLPAIPLDGGHVFREILNSLIGKIVKDGKKRAKVSEVVINSMALTILLLILFPFIFSFLLR